MQHDRPLFGLALMLGFCIVAPMGDAVAKLLGQSVPIGQLLFFRFAIQAMVLIPLVWATARPWRLRGLELRLTVLRTFMHIFGIGLMVAALQYLPLADAVAIAFVMPFLLLVLGKTVLGEEVGQRRILVAMVGFAGTLMVIQPSFAEVGWAALLPLGVALNFALFMLVTRKIAKTTDPIGLQAVSGVFAVVLIAPLLLLGLGLDVEILSTITPNGSEWGLLGAIGLLGTAAHLLMTWSLRYAPAATLAPLQYLEIPVAAALGLTIFGDWPDGLALVGILVTIAAGLYVAITERPSPAPADRPAPAQPSPVAQPAE